MDQGDKGAAPHHVVITRSKLYPEVARPGPAWVWSYNYYVDGGPVCQYGPGLASLRDLLRRKYGTKGVETWKVASPAPKENAGDEAYVIASNESSAWATFSIWFDSALDEQRKNEALLNHLVFLTPEAGQAGLAAHRKHIDEMQERGDRGSNWHLYHLRRSITRISGQD